MKPRTSLILSIAVLLLTFVGARLYVGSQLEQFKEQQSKPTDPAVNVITMPTTPPAPAAPDRPLSSEEQAASRVSGVFGAFTTLVELNGAERDEQVSSMISELQQLDKPAMLAVPQAVRASLEAELRSIGESLPADALNARRAYHTKQVELLDAWGSSTAAAQQQLEAVSGTAP